MSGGSLWSSNRMSRELGSKLCKNVLKMSPNGRPGVVFGTPFGGLEPPWGRFGSHFGVPRCYFSRFVSETWVFVISMPFCSGIATFEGLGSQVGVTWAQKSRPNRLWGALATVECEVLCESYGNRRDLAQTGGNRQKFRSSRRSKFI